MIKNIIKLLQQYSRSAVGYARFIGVKVGNDNFIATRNCWPTEPYLIEIGSCCQITKGVKFFTHGGGQVARQKYPEFDYFGKINVENWVYIGNNALIMPGVTLGEGCLVASGAVVTKSVPKRTVVGGNPAKIICSVDDFIDKNLYYNLNSKNFSSDKKRELLLSLPNDKFISKPYLKSE